jgi:hypothetical protein
MIFDLQLSLQTGVWPAKERWRHVPLLSSYSPHFSSSLTFSRFYNLGFICFILNAEQLLKCNAARSVYRWLRKKEFYFHRKYRCIEIWSRRSDLRHTVIHSTIISPFIVAPCISMIQLFSYTNLCTCIYIINSLKHFFHLIAPTCFDTQRVIIRELHFPG